MKTNAKRATMPAPVMWDASLDKRSGEHTNRARVDMKVVNKGAGRLDLVVTPSAKFLADPDTKYPVTVDPSTSALSNTFDTYVQQGETVDWSSDVELDLGNPGTKNPDGTPRSARSFITWNTTPIQDALIVDTNPALWNFHSGNTDCTAQKWTVWDTSAPSTSSRWTSQPTWNQEYHSSTQTTGSPDCAAQPDGWINADVDTLVQSWASAKATRGHMGLRAATDDIRAWKRVNSANNTANQPKLSVTYNYRPSDGTAQQAGPPFRSHNDVGRQHPHTHTEGQVRGRGRRPGERHLPGLRRRHRHPHHHAGRRRTTRLQLRHPWRVGDSAGPGRSARGRQDVQVPHQRLRRHPLQPQLVTVAHVRGGDSGSRRPHHTSAGRFLHNQQP
ncbi:DNRLRE domain-containing protein [Streptomyces sp. NPDC050433]|uniref:DNRLRE domain-containing protein n=1 Tax=Streptomyces sp. NPDC050433 TaxID=3365615 RepID=UPI0037BE1B59